MPEHLAAIPDEFVDAALEAAYGPAHSYPPFSRALMRKALEAVLSKVRERLITKRGVAIQAGMDAHIQGYGPGEVAESALSVYEVLLAAAFPQDEPGADPGIEVGGTIPDQKGR